MKKLKQSEENQFSLDLLRKSNTDVSDKMWRREHLTDRIMQQLELLSKERKNAIKRLDYHRHNNNFKRVIIESEKILSLQSEIVENCNIMEKALNYRP